MYYIPLLVRLLKMRCILEIQLRILFFVELVFYKLLPVFLLRLPLGVWTKTFEQEIESVLWKQLFVFEPPSKQAQLPFFCIYLNMRKKLVKGEDIRTLGALFFSCPSRIWRQLNGWVSHWPFHFGTHDMTWHCDNSEYHWTALAILATFTGHSRCSFFRSVPAPVE